MENYILGEQLLRAGRYDLAKPPLARAIREGLTDATAYLYLGEAYEGAGQRGAARVLYEQALASLRGNPPEIEEAIQDGLSHIRGAVETPARTLDELLSPPEIPPVVEHGFRYDRCEFVSLSEAAADLLRRDLEGRELYEASESAFQHGDLEGAVAALHAEVHRNPFWNLRRKALRLAARLYHETSRDEMARRYAGFAALRPGEPLGKEGCRDAVERARAYTKESEYEPAIALLERVVEEGLATQDEIAWTAARRLHRAQIRAGRYKDAAVTARRVQEIGQVAQRREIEGLGLAMLGVALEPKPREADEAFCQAIEKLASCDAPLELAEALKGRADSLVALGQWEAALASLARAETIHAGLGDRQAVGNMTLRRAMILLSANRLAEARQAALEAESLALAAGHVEDAGMARALCGRIAAAGGDLESALRDYNAAADESPEFRDLPIPTVEAARAQGAHAWIQALELAGKHLAPEAGVDRADHLLACSRVNTSNGQEDRLRTIDEALRLFRAHGDTDGEARAHLARAEALAFAGHVDGAIEALGNAERHLKSLGNTPRLAEVWTTRGALFVKSGDPVRGLRDLQRAHALVAPLTDRAPLVRILGEMSAAHVCAGDARAAEAAYREAVKTSEYSDPFALFAVEERLSEAHLDHGAWLAAAAHAERALAVSERMMRESRASPIVADLAEGAFALVARIHKAHTLLSSSWAATLGMERFRGFAWHALAPGRLPAPPSTIADLAAEIRRVTEDGATLLLAQLTGRDDPLAYVVATRMGPPVLVCTKTTPMDLIDGWEAMKLERVATDPKPFERFYDILFRAPATATTLDGRVLARSTTLEEVERSFRTSPGATLKIVTQAVLSIVPFAALRVREGGKRRYLIETRPVVLAPMLSMLDRAPKGERLDRMLLWASAADDLEHGRREVETIRRLLAARGVAVEVPPRLSPEDARRLSQDCPNWHLTTHASFDVERAFDCSLHLDGGERLTLTDILSQGRSGGTVVLAGCTTSARDFRRFSTPLSLSTAFLVAGAARVLGCSWLAADAAAELLYETIYTRVAAGAGWAQAVQAAQIAMIRGDLKTPGQDLRAPHFWAGLTIEGAP